MLYTVFVWLRSEKLYISRGKKIVYIHLLRKAEVKLLPGITYCIRGFTVNKYPEEQLI